MPSTISPLAEPSRHRNSTGQAPPPRLQRIAGVDISRIGIIPTPCMAPQEVRPFIGANWLDLVTSRAASVDQLQNRRHVIARFGIRRDAPKPLHCGFAGVV